MSVSFHVNHISCRCSDEKNLGNILHELSCLACHSIVCMTLCHEYIFYFKRKGMCEVKMKSELCKKDTFSVSSKCDTHFVHLHYFMSEFEQTEVTANILSHNKEI